MVKHTQTIRRQQPKNCLSVFDHFVGLVLKGLRLVTAQGKGFAKIAFSIITSGITFYLACFHLESSFKDQLTQFWAMFPFYTSSKHQKTFDIKFFRKYKIGTLARYGLKRQFSLP